MDKNRLALLQLCVAHESEVGRDADQRAGCRLFVRDVMGRRIQPAFVHCAIFSEGALPAQQALIAAPDTVADRKSTRLNSSHLVISYAVFCLKKKKTRRRA